MTNGGWTPGQFLKGLGGGGSSGTMGFGNGPFMKMLQGEGVVMRSMNDQTLGQGGVMQKLQNGEGPLMSLTKGFSAGGGTDTTPVETTGDAGPTTGGVSRSQRGGPVGQVA